MRIMAHITGPYPGFTELNRIKRLEVFFSPWVCTQTLYALTSVIIFSLLFSMHFLRGWQREFVKKIKSFLVGDYLFYSRDLNV